jgi:hypothetical protein
VAISPGESEKQRAQRKLEALAEARQHVHNTLIFWSAITLAISGSIVTVIFLQITSTILTFYFGLFIVVALICGTLSVFVMHSAAAVLSPKRPLRSIVTWGAAAIMAGTAAATSTLMLRSAGPPSVLSPPPDEAAIVFGPRQPEGPAGGPNSDTVRLMPRFPWPPPPASSTEVFRPQQIAEVSNLLQIGEVLERILQNLQYEYRFFSIPGGFVMYCRMERINEDGSSAPDPHRWMYANPEAWSFTSVWEVLRGLFRAPRGYFRIIALAVTSVPIAQEGSPLSSDQALMLLRRGWDRLPQQMAQFHVDSDTRITALIYEFRSEGYDRLVRLDLPGRLSGRVHLERSGIGAFAAR